MSQESLMINEIVVTIADNMKRPETFKTSAKTLGELKIELDKRGIDYSGKVFREGNTVTELLNDQTLLPRMKGDKPLTELFIMMTAAKKNIGSGNDASSMSRMQLVSACSNLVKNKPELKTIFGNISTTRSTILVELYNKYVDTPTKENAVETPVVEENTSTENKVPIITIEEISNDWVKEVGIKCLQGVIEALKSVPMSVYVEVVKSSFSQEDIKKMSQLLQD